MPVTIGELRPRATALEIEGATASQVNAVRRTLLSDLPKLAIEDVEFHLGPIRDEASGKDYDSSTSMFDEGVALRLGLLPIPTDLGQFRRKAECDCKGAGCPHCQVMYSIDRKGPCTVYARDVVPLGDSTLAILEPDVPIVRLAHGRPCSPTRPRSSGPPASTPSGRSRTASGSPPVPTCGSPGKRGAAMRASSAPPPRAP